jgi:methionyl-tRNA formyltransferase
MLKGKDKIISYGYRYIVPSVVVKEFKPVNVHISLLPWNRGADPNFWSAYDGTPSGITIHEMDEGIDTGPILIQKRVNFSGDVTLRESYDYLVRLGWYTLFTNFEAIIKDEIRPVKQHHYVSDGKELIRSLPRGWDTTIAEVRSMRATN